jgi:hypothetical protein
LNLAKLRRKRLRIATKGVGLVKYWEIIADRLTKTGWSLGWVSAIDSNGRTIWIVEAHRGERRFIVRADEKLAAFVEVESAIRRASVKISFLQNQA